MSDEVVINIRTTGAGQSSVQVRRVKDELNALGRAGQFVGDKVRSAGRGMDSLGRSITAAPINAITNQARYAGYALEGMAVYAVGAGLKFNASMEQNEVAFTQFLGSASAAKREVHTLFDLARSTPFDIKGVSNAERQLLAFNFSAKQSNAWLMTIGDAISGVGGGTDEIQRMVTAIGQIKGKGRLQTEELNQLGELGVVPREKLAKNLGITTAELADAGNQGISANRALTALKKSLDDTFGGQSAKQAKSFNGQISTLKDNVNQTLGAVTEPLFDGLRKDALPALNETSQAVSDIFKRNDIDLSQKLTLSRGQVDKNLGPLWDDLDAGFKRLHVSDWISDQFEKDAPKVADAAAHASVKAAGAFVHAWWDAGVWGKLFTLGLVSSRLGVFGSLGGLAAKRFNKRFGGAVSCGCDPGVGKPGSKTPGGAKKSGEAAEKAAAKRFGPYAVTASRVARVAAKASLPTAALGLVVDDAIAKRNITPEQNTANLKKAYGTAISSGMGAPAQAFRVSRDPQRGRAAAPQPATVAFAGTVITELKLDGEVLGRAIDHRARTHRARR